MEAIKSVEQTFLDIQNSIIEVSGQIQEVAAATNQIGDAIDQIEFEYGTNTTLFQQKQPQRRKKWQPLWRSTWLHQRKLMLHQTQWQNWQRSYKS